MDGSGQEGPEAEVDSYDVRHATGKVISRSF